MNFILYFMYFILCNNLYAFKMLRCFKINSGLIVILNEYSERHKLISLTLKMNLCDWKDLSQLKFVA